MPEKQTLKSDSDRQVAVSKAGGEAAVQLEELDNVPPPNDAEKSTNSSKRRGSWREIEARRERAALKASLADVWDDDFDLDDEILAEMDHTADYFTAQVELDEEDFEEADEFFDQEDL